jgi:hypothetical protein
MDNSGHEPASKNTITVLDTVSGLSVRLKTLRAVGSCGILQRNTTLDIRHHAEIDHEMQL